jgi:hypothetical protein
MSPVHWPLIEIGDLLGHRQLQMTKRYSRLATS